MMSQVIHSKNRHYSKGNIPNALRLIFFAIIMHISGGWSSKLSAEILLYDPVDHSRFQLAVSSYGILDSSI